MGMDLISMRDNQTIWDLVSRGDIKIEDLVMAVDACIDGHLLEYYCFGNEYWINPTSAICAHEKFANIAELNNMHPPERRTLVRSALLRATPVKI